MYEATAEYSENIAKTLRYSRVYGRIRTKNGDSYEITNADLAEESLSITSKLNKNGDFRAGGVYSSELSLTLLKFGDISKSLEGARIVMYYDLFRSADNEEYDRIPLGAYWVDGSTIKRRFETVSFKANDDLLNFDFEAAALTGTLFELVLSACNACNVALRMSQADFEALPNGTMSATVNTARIQTWRDLLVYAGIATSSFARINRTGGLEFVPLTCTKNDGGVIVPVREIEGELRFETDFSDDTERVTRLIMRRGGVPISSSTAVTSGGSERLSAIEIAENPLFAELSDEEVTSALNAALSPLAQCLNRAFNVDFSGDPALEIGDYVRLRSGAIDTARGYATGMITSQTWRYRGGHTIKCVLPASVAQESSSAMLMSATAEAASETAPAVRVPPKSQLEKRVDALEAAMKGLSGTPFVLYGEVYNGA